MKKGKGNELGKKKLRLSCFLIGSDMPVIIQERKRREIADRGVSREKSRAPQMQGRASSETPKRKCRCWSSIR